MVVERGAGITRCISWTHRGHTQARFVVTRDTHTRWFLRAVWMAVFGWQDLRRSTNAPLDVISQRWRFTAGVATPSRNTCVPPSCRWEESETERKDATIINTEAHTTRVRTEPRRRETDGCRHNKWRGTMPPISPNELSTDKRKIRRS